MPSGHANTAPVELKISRMKLVCGWTESQYQKLFVNTVITNIRIVWFKIVFTKKRLSLFWRSSNMMMILNHSHWYYRVPFSAKQQIRRNFTIFNLWKKDITVFEEIQFIQQQTFIVRHNPLPRRLYTWPWLHQFVNIFLSFFFVRVACIVKPNTFFIIANPIEHTKV